MTAPRKALVEARLLCHLPEEIVGLIARHMDYKALVMCLATCNTFRRHCCATWRWQALLLRTSWGTAANYTALFRRHVGRALEHPERWTGDPPVEVGVHLVYNFLRARNAEQCALTTGSRLERARIVMHNAAETCQLGADGRWAGSPPPIRAWDPEDDEAKGRPKWSSMKTLSAIHFPVQVEFLLKMTRCNFEQALARMIAGDCVPWSDEYAKLHPDTHFIGRCEHKRSG